MNRILILIIVLMVLPPEQGYAQRRNIEPVPKQSFSLDAEYLPRGFVGDDIAITYKQMYSQMAPKGEYESSDQYRVRIAKAVEKYKDRVLVFRFKPVHMPGLNDDYALYFPSYNADDQELTVDIPAKGPSDGKEVNISGAVTASRYTARNRFGASATITRYAGHLYDIVFEWKPGKIRAKIKIPPAQAKLVTDRLSMLFIGKPKIKKEGERMVESYEPMGLAPTMDFPYEDLTRSHQISMDIISIWIYDRVTMKVLAKVSQ